MIDLHTHLLPGLDDGSASLAETLDLARAAVADGVTLCAVTPHVHPGRYDVQVPQIQTATTALAAALAQAGIPLQVVPGGEVRVCLETLAMAERGELPVLGQAQGYAVVLLEFPHEGLPAGHLNYVRRLLALRIRPLIAHPERNKSILRDVRLARELTTAGCWLQLTAGSILGQFGKPAEEVAHALLDDSLVHVVASDTHDLQHRATCMRAARAWVEDRYGEAWGRRLFHDRAASLLGLAA